MKRNYRESANRKWPRAEWIDGDGRYASVANCRCVTVQLHPTREAAERAVAFIDATGCGGDCYKAHWFYDLETKQAR